VKKFRSIPVSLALAPVFVCLWKSESQAALFSEETPPLTQVIYVVIAVAVIIGIIAIFNNNLLTRVLGRLGNSSGDDRGPRAGEGSVIHHSSGEADFDGSSENVPPSSNDPKRDLPYPHKKSAD